MKTSAWTGLVDPFRLSYPLVFGVDIRISPLCMRTESVPARLHKRKRSQSASYHKRVQKKWLKRFGFTRGKEKQSCYVIGNVMYVSEKVYAQLRASSVQLPARDEGDKWLL